MCPGGNWIHSFKLASPVARPQYDPERVAVDRQRGLLFESEETLVPGWINHIDLWIASAKAQVATDEALEEKRRSEAQAQAQDHLLGRINEKFKSL
jgi:hypothetical protein